MLKQCTKCKHDKDLDLFNKNEARLDGHASRCRDCSRETLISHYNEHKVDYLKKGSKRKAEIKEFIDWLKSSPCIDCGGQYHPCVMDFDHLRDKVVNISSIVTLGWGAERILEEVSKCDIVCANCHRLRTLNRNASLRLT